MAGVYGTAGTKYVGVVLLISDFSDNGLTAMKWAGSFITLPEGYKLCVILIKQVPYQSPSDGPSFSSFAEMESPLIGEVGKRRATKFQKFARRFYEGMCGKVYKGDGIQQTLQYAIDSFSPGLEMLIVGCAAGANTPGSQTISPIQLQLSGGCTLVLVGAGGAGNTINLSPTPTAPEAVTTPQAPAPAPTPAAPAEQRPAPSPRGVHGGATPRAPETPAARTHRRPDHARGHGGSV